MMDPISITAAILGITTATLQSVQFLVKTIDNIKGAPSTIKAISLDLRGLLPVLQSLLKAVQDKTSQIVLSNQIKHAVENCDRACVAFTSQIQRWMTHSTGEKLFWSDRWKIGLLGPEKIKVFKGQLQACKGTLSVALNTATIISTSRQETVMQEMKDMLLQNNETFVQRQIVEVDEAIVEADKDIQHLTNANGDTMLVHPPSPDNESEQSRHEVLQELECQQTANVAFREQCEEALSSTVFERTGQKIQGVKATNYSTALAGFINVSAENWKIDQDISNVSADNYSVACAGVMGGVDLSHPARKEVIISASTSTNDQSTFNTHPLRNPTTGPASSVLPKPTLDRYLNLIQNGSHSQTNITK